jgi:hypothetical protein
MTNFPLRCSARIPRETKFYDPLAAATRFVRAVSEIALGGLLQLFLKETKHGYDRNFKTR